MKIAQRNYFAIIWYDYKFFPIIYSFCSQIQIRSMHSVDYNKILIPLNENEINFR